MAQPGTQFAPQAERASQKKVLWVTNLAAPYRRPVWRSLSARYELTVGLLESNSGLLRDYKANRGADWLHHKEDGVSYAELRTWKFKRGESRFYILKSLPVLHGYDLIVFGGWESPAYWLLLLASIFLGIARVGFYESHEGTISRKTGLLAWARSRFFRCMDRVVVPGKAAAMAMIGLGVDEDKVVQGFNAVDVMAFHEATTMVDASESDPCPRGHRYLFVGQLIERKRVDAIINSFINIALPHDELTIVGSGELRESLAAQARTSHHRINFIGQLENEKLPNLMAAHQTLVLASENEVWGLVVNEALASGMHVVVSSNCGVAESISGMRGVYTVLPSLVDLSDNMRVSRSNWNGRITDPEILQFTPESFAADFDRAFMASLATLGTRACRT